MEEEISICETLKENECYIISKTKDDILVLSNHAGLVGIARIPIPKESKKDDSAKHCIVMGLWDVKNNCFGENSLDITGWRDMLITDIDYFVANKRYIFAVAEMIIAIRDSKEKSVAIEKKVKEVSRLALPIGDLAYNCAICRMFRLNPGLVEIKMLSHVQRHVRQRENLTQRESVEEGLRALFGEVVG